MRRGERPKASNLDPLDASQPQEFRKALKRLWSAYKELDGPEMRWRLAAAWVLTLSAKVAAVSAPFLLADAINKFSRGHNQEALAPFLSVVAIWTLLRAYASVAPQARDTIFSPLSAMVQRRMGAKVFGHVHSLSVSFHQTKRMGALNRVIDRGLKGVDFLIRFMSFQIVPTVFELVLAAGALTYKYGWTFAAAALVTIGIYAWLTFGVTDWRLRFRREMNDSDTEASARAVDSLTNFETVKSFAAEKRETARFEEALAAYGHAAVRTNNSLSLLNAIQGVVMAAGLGVMAALAGAAMLEGKLGPGDIMAATLVMLNLYAPLNILGFAYREIKQGAADMEAMFGLLDEPPQVADAPDAIALPAGPGEVRFETVSFAHDGRSAGLRNVSFTAPAGLRTAIVGPSGAGKSTVLRLVFRFYDPGSGAVTIDGTDLRAIKQESLRAALGLVPQDVVLFNDTLRYNIVYGRQDATEVEIAEALRRAQLEDFVARLPMGLDTKVGERGLKLSGGERQRVGIARVILKDPRILVLDEATSALDSRTEADIQTALEEASRGRTTIVVAHRLSTIADADQIIVLDEGEVVERGAHADLIARGGIYADLWRRQAEEPEAETVDAD
ncbi:MAG: ABC transporter ATP-binding protein/permease [Caulobacterales bacterium]